MLHLSYYSQLGNNGLANETLYIGNNKTICRLHIFLIVYNPILPNKMKMLLAGSHLWTMSAPYVVAVVVVVVVVVVVSGCCLATQWRQ